MLRLDGMLMIGSAGANVGKTELACVLIKKFSENRDIAGLKITTIKAKDGQCPRGGQGCGVCSSLDGDFDITEETNKSSGKDTGRLLAAGASKVFWLRLMKTHLQEGIKVLLDVIGPDAVTICESNSLREVVEPGLFLMVKSQNTKRWKISAGKVKQYADKVIRHQHNQGQSQTKNTGVEHAKGDILLFIDADIVIKNDAVLQVVDFLSKNPDVNALTGLLSVKHPNTNFFSQYKNLYMNFIFKKLPERVNFIYGSIHAIRRKDLLPYGTDIRKADDTASSALPRV